METQNEIVRANGNVRGATSTLEMHLSRGVFTTGGQLSGVVIFRVTREINIRSLVVSVTGCEAVSGTSLASSIRRPIQFFQRDVLLSGRDRPRFRSERISQFWNEFLGRDQGRPLSSGEHVYPFSVPLPSSLPPTYQGKAGKIEYTVTARILFPMGYSLQVSKEVLVAFVPRVQRSRPIALSYPSANGTIQPSDISINVELPQRTVEIGRRITGRFAVHNSKHIQIKQIIASVEVCEWVRGAVQKELGRSVVESTTIKPADPSADFIEGSFELRIPSGASPTVEGTAISVLWFLKIYLDTEHPLEFKAPITVFIGQ